MPSLDAELDELLSESAEAARRRERLAFDQAAEGRGQDLILFGAGNLGRSILRQLRDLKVEPLAFCDNNPRLWGQVLDGLTVLGPEEAAKIHGKTAAFVVTIF